MIRLDSTRISTVVTCTLCAGYWFGFADSRAEGWRVGARHEARAHGGESKQAREALRKVNARDTR